MDRSKTVPPRGMIGLAGGKMDENSNSIKGVVQRKPLTVMSLTVKLLNDAARSLDDDHKVEEETLHMFKVVGRLVEFSRVSEKVVSVVIDDSTGIATCKAFTGDETSKANFAALRVNTYVSAVGSIKPDTFNPGTKTLLLSAVNRVDDSNAITHHLLEVLSQSRRRRTELERRKASRQPTRVVLKTWGKGS